MKFNKLAGLGIASILLFGSVGESLINTKPVQALEVSNNTLVASNDFVQAKKIVKVKSRRRRHHGIRGFRNNRRRNLKRNFRRNYNPVFINRGRRNHRNDVKFDNTFSTGNDFHEGFGRVRLF